MEEKKKKQECLCDTSCFFYILSRFQIHIPRIKSYMGTNIAIFVKQTNILTRKFYFVKR